MPGIQAFVLPLLRGYGANKSRRISVLYRNSTGSLYKHHERRFDFRPLQAQWDELDGSRHARHPSLRREKYTHEYVNAWHFYEHFDETLIAVLCISWHGQHVHCPETFL